mmetsp:Transcript_25375/g.86899  ORF Transcript_25375/g.86899 Transcript_25375/m.86899 type:complete len:213 (+) Transcript_25375:1711-2349(+)
MSAPSPVTHSLRSLTNSSKASFALSLRTSSGKRSSSPDMPIVDTKCPSMCLEELCHAVCISTSKRSSLYDSVSAARPVSSLYVPATVKAPSASCPLPTICSPSANFKSSVSCSTCPKRWYRPSQPPSGGIGCLLPFSVTSSASSASHSSRRPWKRSKTIATADLCAACANCSTARWPSCRSAEIASSCFSLDACARRCFTLRSTRAVLASIF